MLGEKIFVYSNKVLPLNMKSINPTRNYSDIIELYTCIADAAAVNLNEIKTFLANVVSTFFINGKPSVINGLRKLRNPSSWPVVFLIVPVNKIPLISKELITFIITFISFFIRVISVPIFFCRT